MADLDFSAKYEGPIAILKQDAPLSNLEIQVQATFFFDKGISAGSLKGVVSVPEPGSYGT